MAVMPVTKPPYNQSQRVEGASAQTCIQAAAAGFDLLVVLAKGDAGSFAAVYNGPVASGDMVAMVDGTTINNVSESRDIWCPDGIYVQTVNPDGNQVVQVTGLFRP